MTYAQALEILAQSVARAPMVLSDHQLAQQALIALSELIKSLEADQKAADRVKEQVAKGG
jgi:hypothetical protein